MNSAYQTVADLPGRFQCAECGGLFWRPEVPQPRRLGADVLEVCVDCAALFDIEWACENCFWSWPAFTRPPGPTETCPECDGQLIDYTEGHPQ